jgi:hypothetical protein
MKLGKNIEIDFYELIVIVGFITVALMAIFGK